MENNWILLIPMIVGAAMIYTFGLAHRILGCAAEWIYIKSDHSEEERKRTNDFFGKTAAPPLSSSMPRCFCA